MKNTKDSILEKLETKEAVIGIFGLGYVGLPLVCRYLDVGYTVRGFDTDPEKVAMLNAGMSYIRHIPSIKITEGIAKGFRATLDYTETSMVDALIICVPTPLTKNRDPDLSHIISTIEMMVPALRRGQIISLESTTYPGTTIEELRPRIEAAGWRVGEDIFLTYSPEREDPGNKKFETKSIPKILGADSPNCLEVGRMLYTKAIDNVIEVSSTKAAELTKLLENIHRSVNIGLINEIKIVADRMNIDIWEVIEAASTKPFGFVPYYPGPGLGGHCVPIDPYYLTWKAKEYGLSTRFIELSGEINSSMPDWVISKVIDALNMKGRSVRGSKILILGIAYKKNIDDVRESPAIELMKLLQMRGADIAYSDPYFETFPKSDGGFSELRSQVLTAALLETFDLVLLATDHDDFDYDLIKKYSKLVVDTRGIFPKTLPNIVRA